MSVARGRRVGTDGTREEEHPALSMPATEGVVTPVDLTARGRCAATDAHARATIPGELTAHSIPGTTLRAPRPLSRPASSYAFRTA